MFKNSLKDSNKIILAILSTDDHFGFGYKKLNGENNEKIFIKKFDKDLTNNLVVDLEEFLPQRKFKNIVRIAVGKGPANFNASRLIVVLARTLSQQIECSLDGFSSFQIMAKRTVLGNNIFDRDKSFWIFKKLRRRGFIAGKYQLHISKKFEDNIFIKEKSVPKLFEEISELNPIFEANFNIEEDLKELLNLSKLNNQNSIISPWHKVFPIYPISPIN